MPLVSLAAIALLLAAATAPALELCRDDGCEQLREPGIEIYGHNRVIANGRDAPAHSITYDINTGTVTAYEHTVFRAGFE